MGDGLLIFLAAVIIILGGYLIYLVSKEPEHAPNVIVKTDYLNDPYRHWTWAADWRKPVSWRRRWHH